MSRGRTSRNAKPVDARPILNSAAAPARNRVRRAVEHVEMLEERTLLTTLTNVEGNTTVFHYFDASKHVVRIELTGDITAEFTAARVRASDNSLVIRDLIPANPPGVPQQKDGADLFNIYVASASADAQIIITSVPATNSLDRLATPFSGSVGSIRGINNIPGDTTGLITPDGSGSVYIGARTVDITPDGDFFEDRIPVLRKSYPKSIGVRPNTRYIYAGLQTAPGVSLGKVLIGGTITGIVNVGGSVGTFYAGNILTGNTEGLVPGQVASNRNNFSIEGDLQNLYVGGSIGSNNGGLYRSGTQMRINGRLGYQNVANTFGASLTVLASPSAPAITTPSQEAEFIISGQDTPGSAFLAGELSGGQFSNDSQNQQFGYSVGDNQTMSWAGTLDAGTKTKDFIDNYSLPLLAGQAVSLQLTDDAGGFTDLGVFDPLGRLVSTDITINGGATNQSFQIVAKVPGVYRLAVALNGNSSFAAGGANHFGFDTYTLSATGVGTVNLGGSEVGGATQFREPGNGVAIRTGDLGGWIGHGNVTGTTFLTSFSGGTSPISVSRGNLRALYGADIGDEVPNELESLDLLIPRGSVGYIKASGDMFINYDAVDIDGNPLASAAIGGDYQRVEATGQVDSALVANGSIGSIIAGGIGASKNSPIQAAFSANTDGSGAVGNIDMIYVTGNVGTTTSADATNPDLVFTGPALFTGLNGNVKYFHVGGNVVPDTFFGSIDATQTLPTGRSLRLKDDSGTVATFTPTTVLTGTASNVIDPVTGLITKTPDSTTGSLTATTYGVRGTGGVVLVKLVSSTGVDMTANGVGGSFDVTDVVTNSTGSTPFVIGGRVGYTSGNIDPNTGVTTPVIDPITGLPTTIPLSQTPSIPNIMAFRGNVPVNVMHLSGLAITAIYNFTAGEVASVDATSLGSIVAQTVGRVGSTTNADVVIPGNMGGTFPFDGFSRGVNVVGNVISVVARDGVGNIHAGGTLGLVNPNADGKNNGKQWDGIGGDVQAATILNVNIGEGVQFGGTGSTANAGIFASTLINNIVGNGADIRGPIISNGTIGSISLTNGSIVGAIVGNYTKFTQGLYTESGVRSVGDPSGAFAISNINISGDGGILGSLIGAGSFGTINVSGFGIIASNLISTAASGQSNGTITAGGFGIWYSNISTGSSVNTVQTTGNGRVLSVNDYNARVLQTGGPKRRRYDAYSGRLLTAYNDLNRVFGTSRTTPKISGVTNAGFIANSTVSGNGNIGTLRAFSILATNPGSTSLGSPIYPMRVVFANSIGTVNVTNAISGLQLRSGSIDTLNIGKTLERADIGVSGQIGAVNIGHIMRGSASIVTKGGNGTLGTLVVKGGLYGIVNAFAGIGTIGADVLGGTISSSGAIHKVGVNGNVFAGTSVRARRAIDIVQIGGDFQAGATFDAADFGRFRVGGANDGTVINH